jgi:predicted amidohydrolase
VEESSLKKSFKAYALQLPYRECQFERSYTEALTFINLAKEGSLLVLPELFSTGFCYRKIEEAVSFSRRLCEELTDFSRGLRGCFVFTVLERVNGKLFNLVKVVAEGKELLSRPKVKLFTLTGEGDYFTPGTYQELQVVESKWGTIAPVICFELRFFEVLERLKKIGGEVFTVSAQWGRARREHWKLFTRCRAVELQRFLVSSNGTGKEMAGGSVIVDPWGRVLGEMGDGVGLVGGEINLPTIAQVERKLPLSS